MLYQLRAGTAEANRIIELLRDRVLPDLADQIARIEAARPAGGRADPRGIAASERLKRLSARINNVLDEGLAEAARTHRENAIRQAKLESAWQVARFRDAQPFGVDFVMPDAATLRAIVTSQPMEGRLLRDWWRDTAVGARIVVEGAINRGIVQGQGIDAMTESVLGDKGAVGMLERDIRRVVRTAVSHVVNTARMATYDANSRVVKGYKWMATLDTVTCPVCGLLDGVAFIYGEPEPDVPFSRPPAHLNCRCTTVPVLRSFRELGIDADDIGAPSERAARSGRPGVVSSGEVPGSLTYSEWLSRQKASVIDEALGPTRGRLFRAGKLRVDQFVDRGGRPLTVDELYDKYL